MKNNLLFVVLILVLISVLYFSCKKTSNSKSSYFSADIKGAHTWRLDASNVKESTSNNLIYVEGSNSNLYMRISIPSNATVGDYNINNSLVEFKYSDSYGNFFANDTLTCTTGTVTINTITKNEISGTFTCRVILLSTSDCLHPYMDQISNGMFDVKF